MPGSAWLRATAVVVVGVVLAACSGEGRRGAGGTPTELRLAIGGESEEGYDPTLGWGRYGSPLFQSTLLARDVVVIASLGSIAVILMLLGWKEIKLLSFDREFGATLGYRLGSRFHRLLVVCDGDRDVSRLARARRVVSLQLRNR